MEVDEKTTFDTRAEFCLVSPIMQKASVVTAALTALLLLPSLAVQVLTTTGNTSAPTGTGGQPTDPGFANVGTLNGASAIYLGNQWILTASHVGSGTVFFGGTPYAATGPVTQLTNPDTTFADLILFQINADPGLPSLVISPTAPALGNDLVLIGNGANRDAFRSYYTVSPNVGANNDTWTPVGGPGAGVKELFLPSGGHTIRWGTNDVEAVNLFGTAGSVRSFATVFDDDAAGRPFEAQAVLGDSGSAVFRQVGPDWELLGMTYAAGNLNNYDAVPGFPSSSIIDESITFIADLHSYRSQILTIIPEPNSALLGSLALLGLLRRRRA